MPLRLLCLLIALALPLTGCQSPYKKSDKKRADDLKDQSGDPSFQGFIGRLRTAVQRKDFQMLASLMAPDFGYRWDAPPPDETVFTYWNQQNIWPEMNKVLRGTFVPNGVYMVAPPEFAADPDYPGYRAGMRIVNGSWKFAYFVPPPPPEVPTE